MKKTFTYLLVLALVIGCKNKFEDIYYIYPKNSILNIKILRNSERIILDNEDLILIVDLSKNRERYNPHLLFYGEDLKLKSSCYLPGFLDSINNKVIYFRSDEIKLKRKSNFREDLPEGYKFKVNKNIPGSGHQCHKEIQEIIINDELSEVELIVKMSDNISAGYELTNDSLSHALNILDTLRYPISKLTFSYHNQTISTFHINKSGHLIEDKMKVPNKAVLDDFYNGFCSMIKVDR